MPLADQIALVPAEPPLPDPRRDLVVRPLLQAPGTRS
jgi:hypothetical protein